MFHGHVFPNDDGSVARCGGRGLCPICAHEHTHGRRTVTRDRYSARPDLFVGLPFPVDVVKVVAPYTTRLVMTLGVAASEPHGVAYHEALGRLSSLFSDDQRHEIAAAIEAALRSER